MSKKPVAAFSATLEVSALLDALRPICRIVQPKGFAPILSHMWMRADGDELVISGTNFDQTMTIKVAADVSGETTVSAHRLLAFASALPSGSQVDLSLEGAALIAKSCRTKHTMPTLPAEDFPIAVAEAIKSGDGWKAETKPIVAAIKQLAGTTDKNINRPYLGGIFFELEEEHYLVATNSVSLGRIPSAWISGTRKASFIVPQEAFQGILAVCDEGDEVSIRLNSDSAASFKCGNSTLRTKLIAAKYPEYRRIIPNECAHTFILNSADFLGTLYRGANIPEVFSGESVMSAVILKFSGDELSVSARNVNEQSEDFMAVKCVKGGDITLSVSLSPLKWAVESLGTPEQIELGIEHPGAPFVIRDVKDASTLRLVQGRHIPASIAKAAA